MKNSPKVVSLFSGCGGSDFGLEQSGFNVIFANDILPYAKEVYLANMPNVDFQLKSVSEINSFPNADLLVGCYPCQGFSQGGARDPNRKINFLYREFDRALRQIKPKAFIVENVSGMRRADYSHLLNNQVTRFRMAGYRVKHEVLDARDYGVPQQRKRIFIVGIRSDMGAEFEFPKPSHQFDEYRTIGDAIGDLPEWPEGDYNDENFHWYYMSRDRYRGWDECSKTIVANGRHTPLHPISPRLVKKAPDKWVFEDDRPARRYSFRECARLQGFPQNMEFPDTVRLLQKYKVVGNAVPPPLFAAVAQALPDIW